MEKEKPYKLIKNFENKKQRGIRKNETINM